MARIVRHLAEAADELGAEYARAHERLGHNLPLTRRAFDSLRSQVASLPSPSGTEAFDLLPGIYAEGAIEVVRGLEGQVRFVLERLPRLQRTLISTDRLGQEDIDIAREAAGEAAKLSQADTPHQDLRRRCQVLRSLAAEVHQACEFFAQVAEWHGVEVAPTKQGLAALWASLQAARAAPLDLLKHRRPQLGEPAASTGMEQAARRATTLREQRETVQALFDFSLMPPRDELAVALRAMRTSAGFLRSFRPEWRRAARTYRSIRLARPWILRAARCESELHTLITYLDERAAFDSDAGLRRLLGELFVGIDTDFGLVKRLTDWYACARKTFEKVSGPFDHTLLLGLPAETIRDLAARAPEGERYWKVVENLHECVQAEFRHTRIPPVLITEGAPLTVLNAALHATAVTLGEIAVTLDGYLAAPASPRELVGLLEEAVAAAAARRAIENAVQARELLGERFGALATDFGPINDIAEWSQSLRRMELPAGIKTWILCPEAVAKLNALREALEGIEANWQAVRAAAQAFNQFGVLDWDTWQRGHSEDARGIADRARRAVADLDGVWVWAGFSRACRRVNEMNLAILSALVLDGQLTGLEVGSACGFLFYNSIARAILRDNPTLIEFSGLSHEHLRQGFQDLDKEVIKLNGKQCAHAIDQRAQTAPWGLGSGSPKNFTEMALIAHEIQKKKAHVPIRQLVNRAGRALQALKPCFMMGPPSVAQYLEPGKLHFDLIIMDEASQVRPEEAIGVLARGGQMVIVGDPKQLPPTSFFDRFWEGADGEEEREETAAGGMQSILNLCLSRYQPPRQLRWHYRSQHEALIHFSNKEFYDHRLIIFPSAHGLQAGLGLRHHYVAKGLYDNRRNLEEARRVADAAIQHFVACPYESLGVATLNIPQRDLIEEEIDRRLRINPEAERYIEEWKSEGLMPFFVKNLENVQGDERDVIFISTTYGRNREGVVAQRFGPINQTDGWRRLNVLFTRARKRIELFTSLQPGDILVDAHSSRGVRALHDYLSYVRDGILDGPRPGDREPDSDFEIAVADILRNAGYEVVPQLGVAGFFIDLAVRNPNRPGEYIAAIECDGATYHSARSVRDRDRIREEILKGRGWQDRIYRIWSTDWFRDPANQIKRLLAFLEAVREQADAKAKAQPQRQPGQSPMQPSIPKVAEGPAGVETFGVQIGDWVTYCDPGTSGDMKRVQIVKGVSDSSKNILGSHTPLAQALLGAEIGDEVELKVKGYPPRPLKVLDID